MFNPRSLMALQTEIKKLDQAGIEFLILNEGIRLKPYLDSVGIPTIGIGNTYYENGKRVKMTDPPISKARAIELFQSVVKHYETAVWSVTRDDLNQNQFNALVSFTYNIGVAGFKGSTVLKRINAGASRELIEKAFLMWRKPPEIIGRRKREVALYFKK